MTEEKSLDQEEGYKTLTIYILQVNIQKAQDLKDADVMGKSDPFAVITVNDQKYVTKTIEDDLNPVWNEHTTFSFTAPLTKPMLIEVFDYDKGEIGKHDSLGSGTLEVMDFFNPESKGFDNWITLQNVKKGKVYVGVRGKTIKPYDLESRVQTMTEVTDHQKTQINEQTEKIRKLEEEKLSNEETGEKLSNNIKSLKDENDNLQKKLDDTEEQTENQRRLKAVTESEIRLKGEKIEEYLNDIMPNLGEKAMVRKNDLVEAKKKGENIRKEIADIKDNINEVERQCDTVRDDIKNVNSGIQSYVWNAEESTSKSPSTKDDDMRQPLLQSN